MLCGSFVNFILAIGVGSLVIFVLMSLIGNAGVRTGAALSGAGAGFVRRVGAPTSRRWCGPSSPGFWYGAQAAAASGAIVALLTRIDGFKAFHQSSHMLGHSTLEVICFVVIWALQLLIIQRGMETVRRFQDWAGPAVWLMMLVLAIDLHRGRRHLAHRADPQDVLLEKTKEAGVPGVPGFVPGAVRRRRDLDHLFRRALSQLLRLLALCA